MLFPLIAFEQPDSFAFFCISGIVFVSMIKLLQSIGCCGAVAVLHIIRVPGEGACCKLVIAANPPANVRQNNVMYRDKIFMCGTILVLGRLKIEGEAVRGLGGWLEV